jgi:hypothetical protein
MNTPAHVLLHSADEKVARETLDRRDVNYFVVS